MKHLFIELYKKITGLNQETIVSWLNKKIIRNAAEIVSNTLKNALCCDDKNTQRVHDKWCTGKKLTYGAIIFIKNDFDQNGHPYI